MGELRERASGKRRWCSPGPAGRAAGRPRSARAFCSVPAAEQRVPPGPPRAAGCVWVLADGSGSMMEVDAGFACSRINGPCLNCWGQAGGPGVGKKC